MPSEATRDRKPLLSLLCTFLYELLMLRCKPCGRPLVRFDRFLVNKGTVIEKVCWTCLVWSETGYVMPERRV